jgi:hypothetical protein
MRSSNVELGGRSMLGTDVRYWTSVMQSTRGNWSVNETFRG